MTFAEYIAARGISSYRAARELHCDPATAWRWSRGIKRPNREWWAKLHDWSNGAITQDVPHKRDLDALDEETTP